MSVKGNRKDGICLLMGLTLGTGAQAATPPARVVSLNLCADQYLLSLADPSQITSLSPLAHDPVLSWGAQTAARFAANHGSGESLVMDPPDLVVMGPYDSRAKRGLLERFHIPIAVVGLPSTFHEIMEQAKEIGIKLGQADRGAALASDIGQELDRVKNIAPQPRSVLILQRRGYALGQASLADQLLTHMGLISHAARWGLRQGSFVSLEQLIADPPDYLVVSSDNLQADDQGLAFLQHPAFAHAVPPEKRLFLPARLSLCPGPATLQMIKALGVEVRRKVR